MRSVGRYISVSLHSQHDVREMFLKGAFATLTLIPPASGQVCTLSGPLLGLSADQNSGDELTTRAPKQLQADQQTSWFVRRRFRSWRRRIRADGSDYRS